MWQNRIQQNVTLTSYHFVDLLTWCYLKQVDEGEIALDWLLEAQRRAKELDKGIVHQYLRRKLDARRRHFLGEILFLLRCRSRAP